MTSRYGNRVLLLALVWGTVTEGGAWSREGFGPGLAHAQQPDKSAAPPPAVGERETRGRLQHDRLTAYAAQVEYTLRVGRARLSAWEQRLRTAHAEFQALEAKRQTPQQEQAERARLTALTRDVAAAKARHEQSTREVDTLKTFLAGYSKQTPLTLRQETLEVQVSVQWLKTKTTLQAGPSPGSAALTTVSPEQPIIVLATVRGTPWRLVSAAGQYGFLSSALLVTR